MPTTLTVHATERSTYVITAAFSDENGDPAVPTTIAWTLTDRDGTVINSRSAVSVTPAASIDIVLTDEDLALIPARGNDVYVLLIEAVYDSTLGAGLSLRDEARFTVDNLIKVT